jgi:hypothetical protein
MTLALRRIPSRPRLKPSLSYFENTLLQSCFFIGLRFGLK